MKVVLQGQTAAKTTWLALPRPAAALSFAVSPYVLLDTTALDFEREGNGAGLFFHYIDSRPTHAVVRSCMHD